YADRQDLRGRRDAGDAGVVVGNRGNGAGHVAAVPAGVGRVGSPALAGGEPVALVERTAVAAVAVARHAGVADEVIAGQDVGVEVAVVGDTGVEHRDDHAAALAGVPGLVGPDAAGSLPVMPLVAAVVGVVGGSGRLQQAVHLDILDVGVGGQLAHQRLGIAAAQLLVGDQHLRTQRGAAQSLQAQGLAVQGGVGRGIERAVQRGRIGGRRAAVLVFDDE